MYCCGKPILKPRSLNYVHDIGLSLKNDVQRIKLWLVPML